MAFALSNACKFDADVEASILVRVAQIEGRFPLPAVDLQVIFQLTARKNLFHSH